MRKEHFFQKMSDDLEVSVYRFFPDENIKPKAIVQLSHGMVEHVMRYEEFAKALTDAGYIFSAHDHRGHGSTAEHAVEKGVGDFGVLAEKDGFNRVVDDVDEIILRASHDFPGLKVVLFGHSFGSFVSQSYIEKYASHISACILCGTRGPKPLEVVSGKILCQIVCKIYGRKHISKFINYITFGANNRRIKNPKTGSDWLTRDENVVKSYKHDKWCTFTPTAGFYEDMLYGLSQIHKKEFLSAIPKNLPVFLIAGDADPVGDYGKTVQLLYNIYKDNNMEDVTLKLYQDARHELLNEINKSEVTKDILNWIAEKVV